MGAQSEHRLRGHSREARSEKVAFKAASCCEYESIARCCRSFASATRQVVAKIDVSYRFSTPAFWGAMAPQRRPNSVVA
jgi:hypothetical protein